MSYFLDVSAEEASSSGESYVDDETEISTKKKPKKQNKRKKRVVGSDDEEEDNDCMDADLIDFIDDTPFDEREKPNHDNGKDEIQELDYSDLDEDLDEDDYDLVAENTGIRFKKNKKLKRVRMMNDDSDEDERDLIARQLFEDGPIHEKKDHGTLVEDNRREFGYFTDSDVDSMDGFIDDDIEDSRIDKKKCVIGRNGTDKTKRRKGLDLYKSKDGYKRKHRHAMTRDNRKNETKKTSVAQKVKTLDQQRQCYAIIFSAGLAPTKASA